MNGFLKAAPAFAAWFGRWGEFFSGGMSVSGQSGWPCKDRNKMNSLINSSVFRSFIWRLGRRLYCWARREALPSPYANGEYWLLERLIAAASSKAPIFLDIGANKGDWSERAALLLKRHNISGHVYAFEPTASTFAYLSEKFKGSERVSTSRIALSD